MVNKLSLTRSSISFLSAIRQNAPLRPRTRVRQSRRISMKSRCLREVVECLAAALATTRLRMLLLLLLLLPVRGR